MEVATEPGPSSSSREVIVMPFQLFPTEDRGLSADNWWKGFGKQAKNKRRGKSGTCPLLIPSAAAFSVRFRLLFLQPALEGLVLQAFTELWWGFSGTRTKPNIALLRMRTMGCFWCGKEEKEQERRSGMQSDYCQGSLLMR